MKKNKAGKGIASKEMSYFNRVFKSSPPWDPDKLLSYCGLSIFRPTLSHCYFCFYHEDGPNMAV